MSSPRARSRNSARAVRKMIGISAVRSSSSSASATSQPSSPGIITSRRITSGRCARAVSPQWPVARLGHGHPLGLQVDAAEQPADRRLVVDHEHVGHPLRSLPSPVISHFLHGAQLEDERRPFPSLESTLILPPIAVTRPSARKRPRPVAPARPFPPPRRRGRTSVKIRSCSACGMPDALVLDAHLDRVLAATGGDEDGARRRGGRGVVQQAQQHLLSSRSASVASGSSASRTTKRCPFSPPSAPSAERTASLTTAPTSVSASSTAMSPVSSCATERSRSTIAVSRSTRRRCSGGTSTASSPKRTSGGAASGEAVDRGQRRPQLVGDRRDEVRLHLFDAPLGEVPNA